MSVKTEDKSSKTFDLSREIPIKNVYYMLSYAFSYLKTTEDIKRECERFNNIHDLFARILIEGVNSLIKRGFYKEYVLKEEDTSTIRGKININESIKRQTLVYKKLNCQYDEFSEDVLFNQIIKTTINNLIRFRDLDKSLKKDLSKLTYYFDSVSEIDLTGNLFSSLMWNRNNQHYILIINVCELIYKILLPDESSKGEVAFKKFVETYKNEMAKLFENFILNFYKKEFNDFKAYNPHINWDLDPNFGNFGQKFLPKMRTDIVLENESKQLIIDTKFYKEIFSKNFGKNILKSANIYQIYAYVKNSDFKGEISGILLYASLGEDIDYEYIIGGNKIFIKTIDLNQSWESIYNKLVEISNTIN